MAIRSLSVRTTIFAALAILAAVSGASILADPVSPIAITNSDSPDPVASGQELTYTITMVNTGGAKLTDLVFSDQLNGVGGVGVPPQLQITSTRGSCTQNATLVRCTTTQIEGNGSWTVTIRGLVNAANGTTINNTASISGTKSAQNFTSTATATTQVVNSGGTALPDLNIAKTGPTTVNVSSPIIYTLTANNIGTANATGVRVVDTVPAGVTGIAATGTSLFVCSVAGQTVTCDGGAINQGANATITITGTSPAAPATITNTAVVDPDNAIAESNELNNTSALVNTQVTATSGTAQFTILKTDDPLLLPGAGPDPVTPGGQIVYKILVTNTSGQRADDVVIVDGTQGLVASSVQSSFVVTNGTVGNTGGCVVNAPQARCTARTLNPNGTILMTVSGEVINSAGSSIFNTATVTGNIRNTGYQATDTEFTTVKPQYDLTITKADSPDPVCAASWPGPGYPAGVDYPAGNTCQGGLTYTFVVGNSGIQTATGVTVRDPLPAGVTFDSFVNVDGGGFACSYDAPSNVVTCTGGTIPAQSTKTLKFVVVAPANQGPITNIVTVDPNNAIFEADETNNTFAQTTQVGTGIDLTVAKHSNHEADFVATRGTLTYTIKVTNLGTQDSSNILVRDTLPADTIFRDAVSDPLHGFSCSQSGGIVDCINGHLQGTKSMNYPNLAGTAVDIATITIRVFATAYEQAAMHNEVRVDPLNQIGEVNDNNNLAVQNTQVKSGGTTNHAFNELTISKVQSNPDPTNTARNAVVTYVVKVGNDGTDPVVGVKVRDTLPAGAKYIEATGTNSFLCNQTGLGVIDCVGGQIAANTPTAAGATITIKAFAPDTPGTYTNQVEVDPDHTIAEGNEFNNNASAQTIVKNGGAGSFHELSVTKAQTSPLPKTNTARNAIVTYSIVVTNSGSDAVNGVVVRDKLPAGSRYIQATGDHQFLCTEAQTGIVDCVNGQVDGGGIATITLSMFAPDTTGVYTNQVNVDPDNTIPEGDEFNNQATEETTVANGGVGAFNDLTIAKTATPDVKPGGLITYTLQIGNTGSDPAVDVTVRDVLPVGEVFVSAADDGVGGGAAFTCSEASGVVNCVNGSIVNGGSRSITIKAHAPQQVVASPGLQNTAVVDPDNTIPEGDEFNNTASAFTTVTPVINLTITKDGPTTATQSEEADYTIKVTNKGVNGGSQPALGVRMHDPLPVGLIPLTVDAGSDNNWACQITGNAINVIDCLGDLGGPDDGGNEVTITIHVFITAESGPMDNVACVDPDNVITESDELDNCSDHGTFVAPPTPKSPDIMVSKGVDKSATAPGDDLTYTITISNVGTAKAKGWDSGTMTGLTLSDTLSSQLEFTNFTTTNGWTCTESSGTVECHDDGTGMDVGSSAQVTILAHVKDSANVPISNTAVAAVAIVDPSCSDPAGCENEVSPGHIANNSSTVVSSIGSTGIDLSLGPITDAPDPVNPGQGLTYTVVGVNGGTTDTTNVHIAITIPSAGVTFMGAAGSNGFVCSGPVANVLDCHGNLPGGGNTAITVSFITLLSGLPSSVTLSAEIDPSNAFAELNEGNNTQSQTTTLNTTGGCTTCVDLVASQLITTPDPLTSGGTATVQFQVVNVGDLPTGLNPATDTLLSLFVVSNTAMGALSSITTNDPLVTCSVALSGANFSFVTCKGNLAGGQGVTVTVKAPGVTSTKFEAVGTADPFGAVFEFSEGNNSLTKTTVIGSVP